MIICWMWLLIQFSFLLGLGYKIQEHINNNFFPEDRGNAPSFKTGAITIVPNKIFFIQYAMR